MLGIFIGYWLLSIFFVDLCFFASAIFYLMFYRRQYGAMIAGAIVIFCQMIVWEQLPAVLSFLLMSGCVLGCLLEYSTSSYEALEHEYRRTRDNDQELALLLEEKNKTLQEKQDYEIYAATLKERNRIAREIHDNVGHLLSRSILMTGALKAMNKQENLDGSLKDLDHSLNHAMDSIRNSVHDLHDEAVNLQEVLESLVSEFQFCDIEFRYDISQKVPSNIKYSFISIVKEALANVMKHSNATKVQLLVREHPALYQLSISDNGTSYVTRSSSGIGLVNMKDRINALGGNIQFTNDNGFHIFITIPKETKI